MHFIDNKLQYIYTCLSKERLEEHIESERKDDPDKVIQQDIEPEISECSICDDKFITHAEYTKHIKDHIEEIKDIDIEYLKNGHEIFECSSCHFQSNKPEAVKRHLTEHLLQPKDKVKIKSKCKQYKEKMLKSKNWRDMYDHEGNPIFESTDNDTSSEDEY